MNANPFLKWAGGKRWLIEKHPELLPDPASVAGYREPFIGGGAPFFLRYAAVRPAVLSDVNPRLVDAYKAIRDDVDGVIAHLGEHVYDEAHFYATRVRFNREREAPIAQRAAWLIYLNKTCINGLYREAQKTGDFNASFGTYKNPTICNVEGLRACSAALRGVDLRCADFAEALADVRPGELVFLDPPYDPASETANFTSYTAAGFSSKTAGQVDLFAAPKKTDQARLLDLLVDLDRRGVRWVLTQADTVTTRARYARWRTVQVKAKRGINSDPTKRGEVGELVVTGKAAAPCPCDDGAPARCCLHGSLFAELRDEEPGTPAPSGAGRSWEEAPEIDAWIDPIHRLASSTTKNGEPVC